MNMILNTDSYKLSHFNQYPAGTTRIFSYIESRGGKWDETVFLGLQAFIKTMMNNFPTMEDVKEAEEFASIHGVPFNTQGWTDLVELGYWPVEIKAIPEGTVVPTSVPLVTIENTVDGFHWLTSYLETAMLRAVWYPTTVATLSRECKKVIAHYLKATSGNTDGLEFKLHDFGARGVSSEESAGLGGMAHLVNFLGTDTISGILAAKKYYNSGICGFSIPATEHSTMTSWGRENESSAYKNVLKKNPTGLTAIVADSYDLFNAVENIFGDELRMDVTERDGTLVIRPDSGDPLEILPRLFLILQSKFGSKTNSKGYQVLNDKVRVIWGDGINEKTIEEICKVLTYNGWSIENIAFGMGGALLQQIDRDTQKFAMKCSAAKVNGEWVDVFKDPITDTGKRSKKGLLDVGKGFTVYSNTEIPDSTMSTVFLNGELLVDTTFDEVRKRAEV